MPRGRTLPSPSSSPVHLQPTPITSRLGEAGMVLVVSGKTAFQDSTREPVATGAERANAGLALNSDTQRDSSTGTAPLNVFRPSRNRRKATAQGVHSVSGADQHHGQLESLRVKEEDSGSASGPAPKHSKNPGQNGFRHSHEGAGPPHAHLRPEPDSESEGAHSNLQSQSQLLVHRNQCPPAFGEEQQAKAGAFWVPSRRTSGSVDGSGQKQGRAGCGGEGESGPGSPAGRFRGISRLGAMGSGIEASTAAAQPGTAWQPESAEEDLA